MLSTLSCLGKPLHVKMVQPGGILADDPGPFVRGDSSQYLL
jgi:hypothetical protein